MLASTVPDPIDTAAVAEQLRGLQTGKRVAGDIYLHVSAVDGPLFALTEYARTVAELADDAFDLVRLSPKTNKLALLAYPGFMRLAFPALRASWVVDLDNGSLKHTDFGSHANPPILHRKELLLALDHPRRAEFARLTAQAEKAGLFEDVRRIGHRQQWRELLHAKGLRVQGHELLPASDDDAIVLRHRTALSRNVLSAPMQALWRHGYLDSGHTVFDYGCGRGDDLAALQDHGVTARGWDPYYRPDASRSPAAVVNLGFVLNVIEDPTERKAALRGAFALCEEVLAVAVMLGGRNAYDQHRRFSDGVITKRGTFQKYFTQAELIEFVERTLGRQPISVGPGLCFVFRSDESEQAFLARRQTSPLRIAARSTLPESARLRVGSAASHARGSRWERHADLLDRYWQRCLELGRMPAATEFAEDSALRSRLGLPQTVFKRLLTARGAEELEAAAEHRRNDMVVFLALGLFERRRSFGALPEVLRNDIKALWGSYLRAQDVAKQLLFSIADTGLIQQACVAAQDAGTGVLEEDHHLLVRSATVRELPPVLRVYVGCAGKLYGDAEEADVVKIHIHSGKVSFQIYDDYEGKEEPTLIERVKVDLRRQRITFIAHVLRQAPDQSASSTVERPSSSN